MKHKGKQWMRAVWQAIQDDRANVAEDNTQRGGWWIAAVLTMAVMIGAFVWLFGNQVNEVLQGANNTTTAMTTQTGLNTIADAAINNNVGMNSLGTSTTPGTGFSSTAVSSFKAP